MTSDGELMDKETRTTSNEEPIGKVQPLQAIFEWNVTQFNTSKKKIRSPIFQTCNSNWQLILYPKGSSEQYKEWVSLFLRLVSGDDVTVNFELSLHGSDALKYASIRDTKPFSKGLWRWGQREFIKREELDSNDNIFFLENVLRIQCEISEDFETLEEQKNNGQKRLRIDEGPSKPKGIMESLFDSEHLSDVMFVVDDQFIHAHRLILASKTEVFARMFAENVEIVDKRQVIQIKDVEYEILYEVFRFIYTNEVKDISNIDSKLVIIADKYSLEDLKLLCERSFCENLSIDNAVKCLLLAESYELFNLRKQAIEFIAEHKDAMLVLPEFKKLNSTNPSILLEILHRAKK